MNERGSATTQSLAGQLLLAHPSLRDPNFRRTVVLLSAHDAAGALGAVLNRPLGRPLGDVNPEFALTPLAGVPLYRGGPVETDKLIFAAWQWRDDGGEFQLNFGLEPERASGLLKAPGVTVRAFLGYSGWGEGQLEKEMHAHTWFTASAVNYNLNAREGVGLWRMILGSLDPELKLLADEPEDPTVN